MHLLPSLRTVAASALFLTAFAGFTFAAGLAPLRFNNPGLVVDLAVGLWAYPVPMDVDGDGDLDLVVVCPDKPYNGTYVFENTSGDTAKNKFPVFKPARRISAGAPNVTASYLHGKARVCTPAMEYPDFTRSGLERGVKIQAPANPHPGKVRFNQWRYIDYDGDGWLDLTVGVEDWADYGWDRAFNEKGEWTRGPLRGFIYLLRNTGTNDAPAYAKPERIELDGKPLETFGCPSQSFADFDGDGDLDLLCGEFLDGFTYFENIGTRTAPKYAPGRRLPQRMDLEMIIVTPIDWDRDGDTDLMVAQEDGRVALLENTGRMRDGVPEFLAPRFFQQEADEVKFGALATPVGVDWDGDGIEDIVTGNSAGYIGFLKNLGPGAGGMPQWDAPRYLEADGAPIRIMAGVNGSAQGPAEAKWGYTTVSVADWDGDGLPDIVVNSIWGRVVWYRNIGTRTAPRLAAAQPIEVEWPGPAPKPAWVWWTPCGNELATQWRTTPLVFDWNGDSLADLAVLDPEGYLAFFQRQRADRALKLLPGRRIFFGDNASEFNASGKALNGKSGALRLNTVEGGGSGRRKLCVVDWDGDGLPDLLVNGTNANFLRCTSVSADAITFHDMGPLDTRLLAGHDTSPTVVDWNQDGIPDLLIGAEDGHFYFMKNPRAK